MKTTASCFGSESTADAVNTQKPIPHVENTAVRTVPPHPAHQSKSAFCHCGAQVSADGV